MPRQPRPTWSLDPAEVQSSSATLRASGRDRASASRALDLSEATIILRHAPTGLEVSGAIAPGHYSRDRLRLLKDDLHRRLFTELEQRVARHLRVPGR